MLSNLLKIEIAAPLEPQGALAQKLALATQNQSALAKHLAAKKAERSPKAY